MALASCVGEKVANEGISHYDLDNFCKKKPLRKSWLPPSTEGEHRLQPLYYGLPWWLRFSAEQQSTAAVEAPSRARD